MSLLFALPASIMNVIRRIRFVARRWVWRVIFPILTTLFLLVFCFFYLLSLMTMTLTIQMTTIQGPGSPPVHALFHYSLKVPLVVWVAQNPLVMWVAHNPLVLWIAHNTLVVCVSQNVLVVSVEYFRWSCHWNIKSWSNRRIDSKSENWFDSQDWFDYQVWFNYLDWFDW